MADIEIEGAGGIVRALDRMSATADSSIKQAASEIARQEAPRIKARAGREGRRERRAARSVRAVPGGVVGAAGGGSEAAMFYGAEFGGQRRKTTQQFRQFRGQRGYWFWPTLRDDEGRIDSVWSEVLDDLDDDWKGA